MTYRGEGMTEREMGMTEKIRRGRKCRVQEMILSSMDMLLILW